MNTKKMLFLLLPLLFLFNSAIAIYIFQSSNKISESYNSVLDRVLLYRQVEQQIKRNVSAHMQYIVEHTAEAAEALHYEQKELQYLSKQLQALAVVEVADMVQLRFKNVVQTFMRKEAELIEKVTTDGTLQITPLYDELNQLSTFITEDSAELIGLELSAYQTLYSKLFLEISRLKYSGVVILMLTTAISIGLAYWISLRISKPIQRLTMVAQNISEGRLQAENIDWSYQSEFKVLSDALEQAKGNLKVLIHKEKEALEKDKLLKELELEVLQNQINPHFLFNSLNILSKLALIEGAEKTSDLTVALSNLFRYNLKKLDQLVSLKEEIQHTKDYFYIQQARFRDRVSFETNIDATRLNTPVPVLMLQPILENIFVHGMEGIERPVRISLKVSGNDSYTYIEISDNGAGMDEATRAALLRYNGQAIEQDNQLVQESINENSKPESRRSKSTGLGTRNVFRRLALIYQEEHAVEINSRINQGTSILIKIPNQAREVKHVSHITS